MTLTTQPEISTGVSGRTSSWARTTPGWLRVASVALAALMVATGALAALTMLSEQHAARAAAGTAEPLLEDAQTIDIAMADANTTMAGGFLAGPVVPAGDQTHFENDLAEAAAAVADAAQRSGTDPGASQALRALTTDLGIYEGIIQDAETNNRLRFPVASAYLAEANNLMRTTILVEAAAPFKAAEQARLARNDGHATSGGPLVVLALMLAAVLAVAIWLQIRLSRRFRRVINLSVAAATVLVLALGIWLLIAVSAERSAVSRAEHQGANPLGLLTSARIEAQQVRSDDELTLVTRDSDSTYQNDYLKASKSLSNQLDAIARGGTAAEVKTASAAVEWDQYQAAHSTIRQFDISGKLSDAIARDQSEAVPAAASIDSSLAVGVNSAVSSFDSAAHTANNDLNGLVWGSLILLLAAATLVLVGVEPQIAEYR